MPTASSRNRRVAGPKAGEGRIGSRLRRMLDTAMDDDRSRSRKDHAPENLARLRRFALGPLRANADRGSTRDKIKRAAWDESFLLKLLRQSWCDCLGGGAFMPRGMAARLHHAGPIILPASIVIHFNILHGLAVCGWGS